jgi:hypothetical protein
MWAVLRKNVGFTYIDMDMFSYFGVGNSLLKFVEAF